MAWTTSMEENVLSSLRNENRFRALDMHGRNVVCKDKRQAAMNWQSGPEIDASIDRMIFEVQIKRYAWKKTLSLQPRRCYWTDEIIWPFTYMMVSAVKDRRMMKNAIIIPDDDLPQRCISMSSYVYLRLTGKIN